MTGARVKIEQMGGMIPRMSDRLLPPTHAQLAQNVKLFSGEIRGIRRLTPLHTFGATAIKAWRLPDSVPVSGYTWLGVDDIDIDVYRGPLLNDSYDRYYKFGDGRPMYNTLARIRNDDPWYYLGVPAPDTDPTVTPGSGSLTDEDRFYVYTFVSAYGEEGPPTDPVKGTGAGDATWAIANLDTTPADASNRNITHKNIYRTVPGISTTEFFFVAQVTLATTSYNDTQSNDTVSRNALLESTNWIEPPTDIQGAVIMPNGFFVAWTNRTIHLCEAYRPHAWPAQYDHSTEFSIYGAGIFGQSAAIITEGTPYILTGATPAGTTLSKSNTVEPGLAKHSIVSMPYGVLYASQNGLVLVDPSGVRIATQQLVTKNEWVNNYDPVSIIATQFENAYLAFYSDAAGFILDPTEPMASFSELDAFSAVEYIQTDPYSGEVFLVRQNTVYLWDSVTQSRAQYRWRSKEFDFPKPCNIGAVKVEKSNEGSIEDLPLDELNTWNAERIGTPLDAIGTSSAIGLSSNVSTTATLPEGYYQGQQPIGGSPLFPTDEGLIDEGFVRLNVYADGTLVYSELVHDGLYQRLPSGFKADHWSFEVQGKTAIYSIKAAETGRALQDV